MKKSILISEELHKQLKLYCVENSTTVKQVVEHALEDKLHIFKGVTYGSSFGDKFEGLTPPESGTTILEVPEDFEVTRTTYPSLKDKPKKKNKLDMKFEL